MKNTEEINDSLWWRRFSGFPDQHVLSILLRNLLSEIVPSFMKVQSFIVVEVFLFSDSYVVLTHSKFLLNNFSFSE